MPFLSKFGKRLNVAFIFGHLNFHSLIVRNVWEAAKRYKQLYKNEILNTETAITQINKGLKIGKENKLIDWGKSFIELKIEAETFHVDENGIHHIYFGKKEVFPNIILDLYTPFDTRQENFKYTTLNHLGQNLNVSDVEILTEKLIVYFGNPIEKDDKYGFYRKWKINDVIIEIIPRSHHGSDWNAIIIKNKSCL